MDTKPVFHGSDIEKICSYYNLKKENIVKFGANVNPLGLSPKAGRAIAEHVDILSSYPDREYTSLRNTISSYGTSSKISILESPVIWRKDLRVIIRLQILTTMKYIFRTYQSRRVLYLLQNHWREYVKLINQMW